METNEEFKAAIAAEKDRLKAESDKYLKDKGINPILTFAEGNTRIKILPDLPRDFETQYGTKKALAVEHDGIKKTIVCNPILYREVIGFIAVGEYLLDVMRIGAGKDTRYKVNPAR